MKNSWIWIQSIVTVVFLGGCLELVPQKIEHKVDIERNGSVSITYEGTFRDLYPLVRALKKEEAIPSSQEIRQQTVQFLKETDRIEKVQETSPHTYYALWREDSTLSAPPTLLDTYYSSNSKIPKLLQLEPLRILSKNAYAFSIQQPDEASEWGEENVELSSVIREYIQGFDAKVVIDIDEDLVFEHNAHRVIKLKNSKNRYVWEHIRIPLREDVLKFVFSLDSADKNGYVLMSAPDGSDCKSLIGSDCKCGPFTFVNWEGVLSNMGYSIESHKGVVEGCTDANGTTVAIESNVTGKCSVRMMDYNESAKRCGLTKVITQ